LTSQHKSQTILYISLCFERKQIKGMVAKSRKMLTKEVICILKPNTLRRGGSWRSLLWWRVERLRARHDVLVAVVILAAEGAVNVLVGVGLWVVLLTVHVITRRVPPVTHTLRQRAATRMQTDYERVEQATMFMLFSGRHVAYEYFAEHAKMETVS